MKGRLAGALWLAVIVTGSFAVLTRLALIVPGDAGATAANILAAESRFRLGFVSDLVGGALYVGVSVLLYELLQHANRSAAIASLCFGVTGVSAGAAMSLNDLSALMLLRDGMYQSVSTTAQLQAQALAALRLSTQSTNISMLFFGLQIVTVGALIIKSGIVGRWIGALLAVGGSTYIAGSIAGFLALSFAPQFSRFVFAAAILGEGSLTVRLLIRDVAASSSTYPDFLGVSPSPG